MNPSSGTRIYNQFNESVAGWSEAELNSVYREIVFDSHSLFDFNDAYSGVDEVEGHFLQGETFVMDAVTSSYSKLPRQIKAVQRVLNAKLTNGLSIVSGEVGNIKKQGLFASVAVLYRVSDGQSVSIIFHAPDGTPNTIGPKDTLIAFRWMLNSTDITAHVAPRRAGNIGVDISLSEVTMKVAQLIEKNSEKYTANAKRVSDQKLALAANLETIAEYEETLQQSMQLEIEVEGKIESDGTKATRLQSQLDKLMADNDGLEGEIEAARGKAGSDPASDEAQVEKAIADAMKISPQFYEEDQEYIRKNGVKAFEEDKEYQDPADSLQGARLMEIRNRLRQKSDFDVSTPSLTQYDEGYKYWPLVNKDGIRIKLDDSRSASTYNLTAFDFELSTSAVKGEKLKTKTEKVSGSLIHTVDEIVDSIIAKAAEMQAPSSSEADSTSPNIDLINNALSKYGASLDDSGSIVRKGKTLSVKALVKGKRIRFEDGNSKLISSGPIAESTVSGFVEKFWFWEVINDPSDNDIGASEKYTVQKRSERAWLYKDGTFTPEGWQDQLMGAVNRAYDAGKSYNRDIETFVANDLSLSADDIEQGESQGGDFGYDVYSAMQKIKPIREAAADIEAAKSFKGGDRFKNIRMNVDIPGSSNFTSVEVTTINRKTGQVGINFKRKGKGGNGSFTISAHYLRESINEAEANLSAGDHKSPSDTDWNNKIFLLGKLTLEDYSVAVVKMVAELKEAGLLEEYDKALSDIDKSFNYDLEQLVGTV